MPPPPLMPTHCVMLRTQMQSSQVLGRKSRRHGINQDSLELAWLRIQSEGGKAGDRDFYRYEVNLHKK